MAKAKMAQTGLYSNSRGFVEAWGDFRKRGGNNFSGGGLSIYVNLQKENIVH